MSDKNFLEEARKFTPSEKEKVVKKKIEGTGTLAKERACRFTDALARR